MLADDGIHYLPGSVEPQRILRLPQDVIKFARCTSAYFYK